MKNILVIEDLKDWPANGELKAELITAENYLTNGELSLRSQRNVRIFNLCRSYRYQSVGYYVSLLAAARGHKPLPSVSTIADFRLVSLARLAGENLKAKIDRSLATINSDEFTLSIYFGQNLARRHDALAAALFRHFPAPLIRCLFVRDKQEGWRLRSIRPIPLGDVPVSHHENMVSAAHDFFGRKGIGTTNLGQTPRCSIAVLHDPKETNAPSDEKSLQKFSKVASRLGISVEMITRDDYGRMAEFDALFIRETTNVNHHTFRFARRAQSEGLVVIDDPDSILRCSNKVFLAELLERARVPIPKSYTITRRIVDEVGEHLSFPCVLKQPDSAFSLGVRKANDRGEYQAFAKEMLSGSELIVAQEFLPTEYDWRVGVLDREPLYVCKYHMAAKHWQVVKRDGAGGQRWGKVETMAVADAPVNVVKAAVKAANLIGDGLYGVDVKDIKGVAHVIEVNDNPDLNIGDEDAVLKDQLWERVAKVFLNRVDSRRAGAEAK